MNLAAELLLSLAIYLALALVAVAGVLLLGRGAGPWLPLPRLRPGRWSGGEVLLCALLFGLTPSVVAAFLDQSGLFFKFFDKHISSARQINDAMPLSLVLMFALFFALLYASSGTRPRHVGLTLARWRGNVRLGLATFCVATPLILGLNGLVLLVTPHVPHRFEEIAKQDLHGIEWAIVAMNAVVAAPLLEEWLFRGLLQGWLRRASWLGHLAVAVFALTLGCMPCVESYFKSQEDGKAVVDARVAAPALAALELPTNEPVLWEAPLFAATVVGLYLVGVARVWRPVFQQAIHAFVEGPNAAGGTPPIETLAGQTPVLLPSGPRWEAFKQANAWLAIAGSALLFALAHSPVWPSPVALVLFGLTTGWLAYRTQSLLPGMVMHALFNSVAFGVLWFGSRS